MPAYLLAQHKYLAWFAAVCLMLSASVVFAGSSSAITLAPNGQYVLFFKQDIQTAQAANSKVDSVESHRNRIIVQGIQHGKTQINVQLAKEHITRRVQVQVIPNRITTHRLEQPISLAAQEGSPQAIIKWLPLPDTQEHFMPASPQQQPQESINKVTPPAPVTQAAPPATMAGVVSLP